MVKRLLIVEDDLGLQKQLKWSFGDYKVSVAGNRREAETLMQQHHFPVVTLDLGLPPDPNGTTEGVAILSRLLQLNPFAKIIMVTGNNERENARECLDLGAYDFFEKPVDASLLNLIVQRAWHVYELEQENREQALSVSQPLPGIIAVSDAMLKICQQVEKIAAVNVTTVLFGESGTGKELVAQALHQLSDRREGPFIAINCAAIPENLLESELFGYEKGAFTGATSTTKGKLECAHEGTLLLDEIGDLSLPLQAKLLRFLQERMVERVGGRKEISVDVRVIGASHRDLKQMIADKTFREDLYYRLNEVTIEIPPLRERPGDAVAIARYLLDKLQQQQGRELPGFSREALIAIGQHDWPGNIRELENCIKRAIVLGDGSALTPDDLQLDYQEQHKQLLSLATIRDQAEKQAITQAMTIAHNNISQAAKLLDVSRPTFYDLMHKFGLK